ncbi:unnamed protein product [Rangifer tarandus platyrhynchus]|uniref:Serpin domain-containing protein n=1 Tax=Rangifer tarandus platyrhynchus TaxID=3082113 RepID=A0ABN8Z7T0_RANTA|nr:unnamed protein product [Rangifer tarandus platyrhynchus]
MDALCEANGTFALRLLKALCEDDPSDNVFFSPVSLSSVLAMVLLGAKGDTAAQVAQTLSLSTSSGGGEDVHQGFQNLLSEVNRPGTQYLLRTANRLFGEKTYDFLSSFKDACRIFYQAEMEELDFVSATEESRKHINTWVAEKTEGKIRELLPANSINAETRLILVNAVYFKGSWSEKFNKEYTREMPFRINQKEQRPVQMMFQDGEFRLARIQEVQAQVLELPYAGEELSMLVLLPNDHVPLSSIEQQLTLEKLREWTRPESLDLLEVRVQLPRFKLEESYDLREPLARLGAPDLFSSKADLSGMSGARDLFISKVVHKSVVDVNEEGTEAAAATGAIAEFAMLLPEEEFVADHPFIFFIQHKASSHILFLGRLSSP